MLSLNYLTFLVLFVLHHYVSAAKPKIPEWQNMVYNGDHFDDLVIDVNNDYFSIFTVLVLYGDKCQSELTKHSISSENLPPGNFLLFMKYNYDAARNSTWQDMDEEMDLKLRYGSENCLDVLFFKRLMSKDDPPVRWDPSKHGTFVQWVWNQMAIKLVVLNNINVPVSVVFESITEGGLPLAPIHVNSNTKGVYNVFPAYMALIVANQATDIDIDADSNAFLEVRLLKTDTKIAITEKSKRSDTPKKFIRMVHKAQGEEIKKYTKWLTAHTQRHLVNIYQPPLLPSYNSDGYKVISLPKDILTKFITYYTKHSLTRKEEVCNDIDAILDSTKESVLCSKIKFLASFRKEIVKKIQSHAEEYCDCTLKFVSMDYMTLHHTHNVIHRTAENPEKAGITVLMQIMKDVHSKKPWLIELTQLGGSKVTFDLDMGEALIYESAKLVFGRPKPLQGTVHVEVVAHFVPLRFWNYKQEQSIKSMEQKKS